MTYRFPVFLLVLLVGLSLTAFGLFGHAAPVYKKPDPRDAGPKLRRETMHMAKELELTELASKESLGRDEWGHLIDLMQQASCFS